MDSDDDDLDLAADKTRPKTPSTSPLTAVGEALLADLLTPAVKRQLSRHGAVAIVVVPHLAYAEAVTRALRAVMPEATVYTEQRKKANWAAEELEDRILRGNGAIAVTTDESTVPAVARVAATLTLSVPRLNVAMVRQAVHRATGHRLRGLTDGGILGCTPPEIAAAMHANPAPAEILSRIRRLADMQATPRVPLAPTLHELPVFGEARDWANEAVEDLRRLQTGELSAIDFDGGILLHGPPGTGKPLLARSVARSAGLPLIETSAAGWFASSDGHLGGVIKAAESFFQSLIDRAPAVGLIDELEAIPDRAALDARACEWWNSLITGVLLMVSRVRASGKPVLLIAATNYADRVDAALLRPGRLGRHVLVRPAETEDEVAAVFRHYAGRELSDADLAAVARLAGSVSPARIEGWIKTARRRARDAGRDLELGDLVAVIAPPDERPGAHLRRAAIHEAGHAIVALEVGLDVVSVTVVAEGVAGGKTSLRLPGIATVAEMESQATMLLAGRAAETVVGAGATTGAGLDLAMATHLIVAMHASEGLRGSLLSLAEISTANLLLRDRPLRRAVEADLKRFLKRAVEIVTRRHADVCAHADALLVRRILTRGEIDEVLADRSLYRDRAPTGVIATTRAPEQHAMPPAAETLEEAATTSNDDEGGENDADAPTAQTAGPPGEGDRR